MAGFINQRGVGINNMKDIDCIANSTAYGNRVIVPFGNYPIFIAYKALLGTVINYSTVSGATKLDIIYFSVFITFEFVVFFLGN